MGPGQANKETEILSNTGGSARYQAFLTGKIQLTRGGFLIFNRIVGEANLFL